MAPQDCMIKVGRCATACRIGAVVLLMLIPILAFQPAESAAGDEAGGCRGADGGTSVVVEISGGETLILEDGRAVRLIGILSPKRARSGPAAAARARMEEALAASVLGRKVALHLGERKRDRYGRVLAQIMVLGKGEKQEWLQARLVEAGLARVISFERNRLCVRSLLDIEARARQARNGLWGDGFFAVRPADAEDRLYRLARNFELVEGKVENVAKVKGRIYINFGENWRRDFTAFIPAGSTKQFEGGEDAGLSVRLRDLKGRSIRVRGWLKNYNGPSITVTHPEQIEVLDKKTAALR